MDTNIVYQARMHWIIFVSPLLMLLVVGYVGVQFVSVRQVSMLLGIFAVFWTLSVYLMYRFCSLTIRKNQLVLQKGFLVRQTMDIPLTKVASVNIQQNILGAMLGYGNIQITDTGGSSESITYIAKPLTCRRYIEQLISGTI
jgi:uncharacterized membrane protein YdbT with pleckstrin-like domain